MGGKAARMRHSECPCSLSPFSRHTALHAPPPPHSHVLPKDIFNQPSSQLVTPIRAPPGFNHSKTTFFLFFTEGLSTGPEREAACGGSEVALRCPRRAWMPSSAVAVPLTHPCLWRAEGGGGARTARAMSLVPSVRHCSAPRLPPSLCLAPGCTVAPFVSLTPMTASLAFAGRRNKRPNTSSLV